MKQSKESRTNQDIGKLIKSKNTEAFLLFDTYNYFDLFTNWTENWTVTE